MQDLKGYREVIPDQTAFEKWIDVTLNTGGSQSTLQDFKVAERSGGMSYLDQNKYYTRNRFIYWRTNNHVLELIEESLDITLIGNRVRYKFTDAPVLEGVTVCEVPGAVLVLVPTVASVHRLSFPHPDVLHNSKSSYPRAGVEYTAQSIFADANANIARNPSTFHILNNYDNSAPQASASGASDDGQDCIFALAYPQGSIMVITLNAINGTSVTQLDPNADALMPRFFSRAFRSKKTEDAVAVSLALHHTADDNILFSLCRDGNVRAWSLQRQNFSVVTDFPPNLAQGAQTHQIRCTKGANDEFYVAVFHCYPNNSSISVLKPSGNANNRLFMTILGIHDIAQEKDVVDFAVTGSLEVWMVLRSSTGDTTVELRSQERSVNCVMDTWETPDVFVDQDLDPKQAYLNFIFHPGRFPVSVINKTLSIYRKANIITDSGVPTQVLKERVCAVVDSQIYGETRDREYSAEELLQLQNSAWQKFYSRVLEYYESGTRPLGLVVLSHPISQNYNSFLYKSCVEDQSMQEEDEPDDQVEMVTSGVVLIKKNYVSFLRPLDEIEATVFDDYPNDSPQSFSTDVAYLVPILTYLDENLPEEGKINFEKSLKQLKTPLLTVSELFAQDLSFGDGDETMTSLDLLNNIAINVEKISNISQTIGEFLDLLDVGQPDIHEGLAAEKSRWLLHLGHLFGSQVGMSFAATSLHQTISLRFSLCRSLLIFEQLIQSQSFRQFLPPHLKQNLNLPPEIMERTSQLIQCHFLILWISSNPMLSQQFLVSAENSVSILKLNAVKNPLLVPQHDSSSTNNITLLQLFLQSSASTSVRLLLSRKEISPSLLALWKHSFISFVHVLIQLLWPICNNTIFPEFLLIAGQHLQIQEYNRLLSKWCFSNSFTRKFLLACSLLDTGEHEKAYDLFEAASMGVTLEDFLKTRIVKNLDSQDQALISYYTQVIKLFEQQGMHHLVVQLAQKAISHAKGDEPELPTLHSVAFFHQLQLGLYQDAFDALLENPDSERRKDCLQQLVVTLVDARCLNILMDFNYDGVRQELERIVEVRARSLEVTDNPYYSFAYAYHVQRGCMRKAGCVMYEQALRLSAETSIEALQMRCRCLVAAITALSLVKKQDAWIVRPLPVLNDAMETDEREDLYGTRRRVEVLELRGLEKELAMCKARLKMATFSPEQTQIATLASYDANELVGLLSNACLFKDALNLARLCGVSKGGILSQLAGVCVRLDESNELAADWLRENDARDLGDGSDAKLAWRLLEKLLDEEEPWRESSLHRSVTSKLLHLGVFLPLWLVASYKKRNPAELLRLLLTSGRLEEAAELAVEYIEAVMGKGKERFGLEASLLPQNPAIWLPWNTLDIILLELEAHEKDGESFKEILTRLSGLRNQYLTSVATVSNDKLKILLEETSRLRAA